MATNRLNESGVEVEIIDLTENPDLLDELKRRLGKGPAEQIQVPLFEDENDEIFNISHLRDLEARAKAVD